MKQKVNSNGSTEVEEVVDDINVFPSQTVSDMARIKLNIILEELKSLLRGTEIIFLFRLFFDILFYILFHFSF
jgi:hypothetical protein